MYAHVNVIILCFIFSYTRYMRRDIKVWMITTGVQTQHCSIINVKANDHRLRLKSVYSDNSVLIVDITW